ncbi:GNAT family N-acetyltransferase [Pleomorphomonas diazotrophica]|uniref:GNAT family N-acetyltransferase n=1 Tax=Pleomorphomonas diazotrophica TaxID=1166257 RepID=A0A1I4SCW2_9HYPH|nr:GNAT family protein [Pleomorphomonas diazotrophica]PKR88864.1 GNAT family N-acetyltransferase [Pleomorphomonas diazotrophica]SFM62328.1 Protein N-acetyltransferase, RimJ/RimL family [Pleomorphomonas diazotrophica]
MSLRETDGSDDPIGPVVVGWAPRPRPSHITLEGRTVRLEPLSAAHVPDLFAAYSADTTGRMWTYLSVGPFARETDFAAWIHALVPSEDPLFFAARDKTTGRAVGIVSYLRIDPANGSIEVGWVTWSPLMQRSPISTEAHYLLMKHAFDDLGYRRYEWKCNALNAPSMKAAERLGFTYEGTFRQAVIVKGRNRDTAWFSVIDNEWPALKRAFEAWLNRDNFDAAGRQKKRLQDFR